MDSLVRHADPARSQGRQLLSGWRLVAVVLVTSTVLGFAHYFQPAVTGPERHPTANATEEPDLTIIDATITSFRKTGELKYRLRSPQIEHFTVEDRADLRAPDLTISSEPDPPWHVTAEHGVIRNAAADAAAEEEVVLSENVRMAQDFPDGRRYLLETPAITIYPERQYAESTRDVMITTHAGRTRAVGLKGNLDQGLLKLFSNDEQRVHTVILADQFK